MTFKSVSCLTFFVSLLQANCPLFGIDLFSISGSGDPEMDISGLISYEKKETKKRDKQEAFELFLIKKEIGEVDRKIAEEDRIGAEKQKNIDATGKKLIKDKRELAQKLEDFKCL